MKLVSLLLGLGIGATGTAAFYAYSFDKSEYDWVAPQSVRAEITASTATLGGMTGELLKNIETWTGVELDQVQGSLNELTGSTKSEDDHAHDEAGHKHDDHGDEKEHGHSEEGHKHDDHGDEKEHGHNEGGHKDDDHGDEKEYGHGNDDDGHGHAEEDVVRLTASQQKEFGIEQSLLQTT